LPTGAPDLSQFSEKSINVFGNTETNSFAVEIIIDSVSVNPPGNGLIVSPASGSFSRLQRFDAALLLPPGKQAQHMQAFVGGMPVPFGYPNMCSSVPPNSQGRAAILCPDAPFRLPDGASQIEWRVDLTDGTMLAKSVTWELIP
jgi:hypothetical protein